MAKRSRGAARPGQTRPTRRPSQRPAGRTGPTATEAFRPATTRAPIDDTALEETDFEFDNDDRAVGRGRRDRGRAETAASTRVRAGQTSTLLAARAAEEYGYVVRDVRRIGIVGGGLIGVMLVLYVLVEVVHVISL
jgi:hypothetical protein